MPNSTPYRIHAAAMLSLWMAAAVSCTPTQTRVPAPASQPPPTVAAQPAIAPPASRKLVAIAGFENRSTFAADKLWDTCSQLLSSHLIQMGYFRVVEWERMKRLFDWEELSTGSLVESPAHMDKARKILMCEYFISGAVTHFDVSQRSQVSAMSKSKTLVTTIRVDLTLQNARTGEYISAGNGEGLVRQEFKGGMSGGQLGTWDPKAADQAITMAIEKALYQLTLQFSRMPPEPATTVAGAGAAKPQFRCPSGVCTVNTRGVAGIPGGFVERARLVALRSAYSEAVSQVAGVQIGSLTVVKNFQLLSDMVTSRTRGFIKSYQILDEGVAEKGQDHYYVDIQADVLESGAVADNEVNGLQLYVELLENPTVLILLEEERFARPRKDDSYSGALQRAEASMARVFSNLGYQVVTSDDLVGRPLTQTDQGAASPSWSSQSPALRAARAVGADLVIAGAVSSAERQIEPAKGVAMVMVSAELRAKAVLAASGKVARVFQFSDRASHRDALVAHVDCLTKLSQTFSKKTAWEIPQLLAQEERQTLLIIEKTSTQQVQRIQKALTKSDDIEAVRLTKLPTANSPEAVLQLKTGYIQLSPQEVLEICRARIQDRIKLIEADKFQMRISL
jgi:curli biogenesis system outer membrane secretion channel CsgG